MNVLKRAPRAIAAIGVAVSLFASAAAALAASPASPAGCNADNSVVNIARSTANAQIGQTITFTVSAGNPASGDGCDITNRTMTLTLPDGSTQVFGPNNYPNPSATAFVGSANYVAAAVDLVAGKWNASVTWTGTQLDGNDSASNGVKNTSVNQVDANIQITPNGTNRVGANHVFTGHVNVNSGSGFVNAPDGTQISFTIDSGPGSFTTPNPCTTSGGTGSCQITLSSAVTGVTTVSAHTAVSVGGVSLTRDTSGTGANSGPAVKTWINAKISIAPDATNEVGAPHTFTVTLQKDAGSGFVAAAGEHVDFTLTNSNGAGAVLDAAGSTCDDAGANTNGSGQCTIKFTSPTAGKVTGHAKSTLSVGGSAPFTVETDGVSPNSGDAVKTFVNANIQITPANATNPIGTNHTLTGHVNVNDGSGVGYVAAPAGTTIKFVILSGPGSFVGGIDTCNTVGVTGSCTVQITSSVGGTTVIRDKTDVTVSTVPLHRESGDGKAGDSVDANKVWAGARISIAPNATNEVGAPHTFTVTLEKDTTGNFLPAAGEHVDVTLTDSNGAVHTAPTGTCTNAGSNTNASGQCTITFSSPTAGKVTGHASATLNFGGGVQITVQTDGQNGNSNDAIKTFVDAKISVTPNGTNPVNANHVFTATAMVNDGSGAGFQPVPNGTSLTFAFVGPHVGSFTTPNPCTTTGGSCSVTDVSATAGADTVSAALSIVVGGVTLNRTTGDGKTGDGPNAIKNWGNARISITPDKTNEVGQPHTFTVKVEKDTGSGFGPASGEHVTVTLTDSNGATHGAPTGSCTNAGPNTDGAGQCTITFSSPTAGKVTGHAAADVTFGSGSVHVETNGQNGNSADAVKTYVDANIQINPPTADNPVGTNHVLTGHVNINDGSGAGYVNAPVGTTINFTLQNSGGATAAFVGPASCNTVGANGDCTVTISSPTAGQTTIKAKTDVMVPTVGGLVLHRETADGKPGDSADAIKNWNKANSNTVTEIHNVTDHSTAVTSVPLGSTVDDKTTVSGTAGVPTGTVGFTFYTGVKDCSNQGAAAGSVALDGAGVAHPSLSQGPLAAGQYSFKAHYNGDAKYNPSDGLCEPLTVNKAQLGISTTIHDASHNPIVNPVAFNSTVHDSATVSGIVPGFTPANSVAFSFFNNGTCAQQGVSAGNVALSGNTAHPSNSEGPLATGNYSFSASIADDPNYIGTTAECEPLQVGQGKAEVTTEIHSTSHQSITSANIGDKVHDKVMVTDTGPTPTGTVTVDWFTNGTCEGQPQSTSQATSLDGSGNTDVTAFEQTVANAGSYSFLAHYAGDANYPAANAACEPLSVGQIPSNITTEIHNASHTVVTIANAGDVVHDKAIVTGNGVLTPTGTVTFQLYPNTSCSGNTHTDETVAVGTESSPTTVSAGLSYKAVYSGDSNYSGSTGACEPLPVQNLACPAGSFSGSVDGSGNVSIKYDQFPAPNDNSYGVNAVGWGTKGHKFSDLTGSDKAGFQVIDPSGVVKLSFNIDYISAKTGTPSGYASLGAFGGDGSIVSGTLNPDPNPATNPDISWDTSFARDLNNLGYFTGGVQTIGTGVANLLIDSPPTLDPTGTTPNAYVLTPAAAAVFTTPQSDSSDGPGWNFHDTYFVTIKAAKLIALGANPADVVVAPSGQCPLGKWCVTPNLTVLHNSPAKACPGSTPPPPPVCTVDTTPKLSIDSDNNGGVWVTYQQSTNLNDNSYGVNSVGWTNKVHKFSDLTGSDKAEIVIKNLQTSATVFDGFFDYISAKTGTPSGYDTLGVTGGDGSVSTGQAAWILPDSSTSFSQDLNFNVPFSAALLTDSPAVSPANTYSVADPAYSAWDFNDTYYVHISKDAFGGTYDSTKFSITVPFLHNSPSKACVSPAPASPPNSPSFSSLHSFPPPPPPGNLVQLSKKEVHDKDVKVSVKNTSTTAKVTISEIDITWPNGDGNLQKIELPPVLYDNPPLPPPSASVTTFKGSVNDRTIDKNQTKELKFHFANNAAATGYVITIKFVGGEVETLAI